MPFDYNLSNLVYPTDVVYDNTKFFNDNLSRLPLNNSLYYANSPLIVKKVAGQVKFIKDGIEYNYSGKSTFNMKFRYEQTTLKDIKFIINGIEFKNSTVINGRNIFLKTNNYDLLVNSLKISFQNYEFFDNYNINYSNINNGLNDNQLKIDFYPKTFGIYPFLDIYFSQPYTITYGSNAKSVTYNTTDNLITSFKDYYLSETMNEDVINYGLGIEIYKNYLFPTYIGTLLKKDTSVADFNLTEICKNYITSWRPSIKSFEIKFPKSLDLFYTLDTIQFTDKRYDVNNNYVNKFRNENSRNYFYLIDGNTDKIFDNNYTFKELNPTIDYDYPSNKYSNTIQSLEYLNAGTYGNVLTDRENNFRVFDRVLSKMPRRKKFNKGYELMSTIIKFNRGGIGSSVPANINLNYKKYDGSVDYVSEYYNVTNIQTGGNGLNVNFYIQQFSFNKEGLFSLAPSTIDNYKEVEVWLETFYYSNSNDVFDSDKSDMNIKYEKITYYLDDTDSTCEDSTIEDNVYTSFVFKNSKGAFDIFEFEEVQELNTNRKLEYINIPYTFETKKDSDFTKIWNFEYDKSYKVSSRILDDEEFNWLEDLIKSKEVYIIDRNDNDILYPILILDSNYGFKKGEDKILQIQFKYSRPEQI